MNLSSSRLPWKRVGNLVGNFPKLNLLGQSELRWAFLDEVDVQAKMELSWSLLWKKKEEFYGYFVKKRSIVSSIIDIL